MSHRSLASALLLFACSGAPSMEAQDLGLDQAPPSADLAQGSQFLDAASYADELKLSPSFPFGVTRRHTTTRALSGARWGRHGGPLINAQVSVGGTAHAGVTRFALPSGSGATGALSLTDLPITEASGLPASVYYNAMLDLPLDDAALLSYSGSGAHFQGEALLYSSDYATLRSRASTNGFYDAVSTTAGVIFYTGLSGLAGSAQTTEDNGLWRSDLCSGALVPGGSCAASRKLVGWTGYSGPVVADSQGNVFVAASLSVGAFSDEVYAMTRTESMSSGTPMTTTLLSLSTNGTSSLAAAAPSANGPGWLLQKGYDSVGSVKPATAQAYSLTGGQLKAQGAAVSDAIQPGAAATGFSLMTDSQGGLWVAVAEKTQSVLLQLQPR